MFRKLIPFVAVAALFFTAEGLQAQSGSGCCSKKNKSECSKESKEKKAAAEESIQFSTITHDQLLQLMQEEGIYLLDARGESTYNEGHIDGAILFANFTLPEDKNTRMIFYCGGPKCSAAPKAARKVIEEGYTNVMVYHGGWMEWSEMASSQAGL